MTDKTPSIFEALSLVMGDVRAVGKDGWNDNQKFKFRGVDAVVNAVAPALRNRGVLVVPELQHLDARDVKTSTGKPSREISVRVRYRFYGPSGDYIDAVVPGEAMDSADKGTAKAMSVAFRIALLQALALPTDDTDPDATYDERGGFEESLPTEEYIRLSGLVDAADNPGQRRVTWAVVTEARKTSAISQEEATDLYTRLTAAVDAEAKSVTDEQPVTVQRAVKYAEHAVGPEVQVDLPGWP